MSYNNKNNVKNQLAFLNKFLYLYGIHGLRDTDTEIKSSDLTKFDEMTDQLGEIRKLFKVSSMNLSRNDNKITKTNAIPVLKHMCSQARVPIDTTKYVDCYTFSLAPRNVLLDAYRDKNNMQVVPIKTLGLEKSYRLPDKQFNPHIVYKPFSYFENLPHTGADRICVNIQNKKECVQTGNDIAKTVIPLLDEDNNGHIYSLVENDTPVVTINTVKIGKVTEWYNGHMNFISVPLDKSVDIYYYLRNITLYDQEGFKMPFSEFGINNDTFIDIKTVEKTLNIPIWSLPYSQISVAIFYEEKKPHFFKVEFNCAMLQTKYRSYMCKDFNGIDISNGSLSHKHIRENSSYRKIYDY